MTKTGWQWRLKISNSGTTQQFTDMNLTSFPDFTLIEECVLFVKLGVPIFSTEKEMNLQLMGSFYLENFMDSQSLDECNLFSLSVLENRECQLDTNAF